MARATRLVASVCVAVLGAATLTGCNAVAKPLIAVVAGAGHPAVVIRLCKGTATTIGLHQLSDSPRSTAAGTQLWVIANENDSRTKLSVDLFSTPDGWRQAMKSTDALDPAGSYSVDVLGSGAPPMSLDFTATDLEKLGPDQVFALTDTTSTGTVLSAADFDKSATRSCSGG